MHKVKSVEWLPNRRGKIFPGCVRILDQTKLPNSIEFIDTANLQRVFTAIKTLQVRGAPAIGVAAAMGAAASIQALNVRTGKALAQRLIKNADYLATSRPTAVNLFWALDRIKQTATANVEMSPDKLKERLIQEAIAIRDEDAAMCRAIGEHGVKLLRNGATVITHCNAGALATSEFGTALAPIYVAKMKKWKIHVYADETRPLLQGARLTAWELQQAGVDVTLICDNTAAHLMLNRKIDAVMVGADRIAANGDTANKIGTYGLALAAKAHNVPFYVLAPTSTFDLKTRTGKDIPIEERSGDEVTSGFGRRTAPQGIKVFSPAFDVTPARLIAGIICEKGIARPDFSKSLLKYTTSR